MARFVLAFLFLLPWLVACQPPVVTPTATPTVGPTAVGPTVVAPTITSAPATAVVPSATPSPTLTPTVAVPAPIATIEVSGASLPPGFSFIKYADFYRPTSLTFDSAGRLYATSFDGTLHVFSDSNQDGRADGDSTFSFGFNTPLGIAIHALSGDVYVSSQGKISILRDVDGDLVADEAVNFVNNLPFGRHQNDNLKFGPDGRLYIGVGSTCDVCQEADPRSATIMRFDITTGQGEVWATGLRNPYDLAFHPATGDLFATDNGRDDLGDDAPQEELNQIVQGADYGWPDCWDEGVGPGCARTETAVAFFESHASANSLTFYSGSRFPADYRHNAYVAIFGSWLKSGVQTGIARVVLKPDNGRYRSEVSWLATWPGMPLGLTEGPDGALYVGDYTHNAIYRLSYGP